MDIMKYNYTIMVLILVVFLALFASYGKLTLNENTKVIKYVEVEVESKSFLDLLNNFITDVSQLAKRGSETIFSRSSDYQIQSDGVEISSDTM